MKKVVVIGQGYVGLPLSVRAVDVGHNVVGIEVDPRRLALLRAGQSYVEDIPTSVLQNALSGTRYVPTDDYGACAGFDVAVITVHTPLREGVPDISYIEAAGRSLAPSIGRGATVVLESTTYPGTTQELLRPILEAGSGLDAEKDFFLGFSPERIDPGNATFTFVNTPKVVAGIDSRSLEKVADFYSGIVDKVVPVSSCGVAELCKLLENTFRHVNIALVNELAMMCNAMGIDIWETIDAAATKPFGFMKFTPGPGVGGHCLPIDPSFLSWRIKQSMGRTFRFVELANDINEHMPSYVVMRLMAGLNMRQKPVSGSRIVLLGLAYKSNSSDARESPAVTVAAELAALGADLVIIDPLANLAQSALAVQVRQGEFSANEFEQADAVVVLTNHDVFDLAFLQSSAKYVLDTRHCVPVGDNVEYL